MYKVLIRTQEENKKASLKSFQKGVKFEKRSIANAVACALYEDLRKEVEDADTLDCKKFADFMEYANYQSSRVGGRVEYLIKANGVYVTTEFFVRKEEFVAEPEPANAE